LISILLFFGCVNEKPAGYVSVAKDQNNFSEENKPVSNSNPVLKTKTLCFENGKCISVEIAEDFSSQAKGLMDRNFLAENAGMLFVFEKETITSFWMKNMKISLDIIWIDSNYAILGVEENVPPCNAAQCEFYSPKEKVMFVLEVNAGFFEKNDLNSGQKIGFFEKN